MICPNCGFENPDTNLFCTNCGTKLAAEAPIPMDNASIPVDNTSIPVDNTSIPMDNNAFPTDNEQMGPMPYDNMNMAPTPDMTGDLNTAPFPNMTGNLNMGPNMQPNMGQNPAATTYNSMQVQMAAQSNKKNPALIGAIAVAAAVVLIGGGYYGYNSLPSTKYAKAEKAFQEENYEQAVEYYESAGDYEDAPQKAQEAELRVHYQKGVEAIDVGDYDTGISELEQAGNYSDTKKLIKKCHYEKGLVLSKSKDYKNAKKEFVQAGDYSDAASQIIAMGEDLVKDGKYEDAIEIFKDVAAAKDNKYNAYAKAMVSYNGKDYDKAAEYFFSASDVLDAKEKYKECEYESGKEYLALKEYDSAKSKFKLAANYEDSDKLIAACDLMNAKAIMDQGKLNTALTALKQLPEGTEYNGISAADLISTLESHQKWVDICGLWTSTSGQMKTTETTSTYRSWWYHDFKEGDTSLDVKCVIKSDGTVDVSVTGFIMIFTNYAKEEKDLKESIASITTRQNLKDFGTIKIDGNTSVTLKKGKIVAEYKKSESRYNYNTTVTYGKRTIEY